MSITPLKFTGISSFSEDFQTILARAVSIASVPVQQLQNSQMDLLSKKQSLAGLRTAVADLALSIEALGSIGETRALSITSTNANRVSVTKSGPAVSGVYHITDISAIAAAAGESFVTGLDTVDSTPVDADGELELVFGTATIGLTLTSETNNLTGLRDAINNAGIGLTVSIINSGAESGAYYLSVTAQQPGATALALRTEAGNNATNLLTTSNQGANADFYLNGIRIICSDNTINDIVDGLTLNIVSKTEPEEEVTISASSSRGSLATGINNFVSAYNAAASVVNGHIGENAGVLSGDPILRQIQSVLRQATGYTGSGAVSSLAGLGIELDKKGTMSFNSAKFYALSTSGFEAGMDLMGSTTTGFGALSRKLDEISNPITGLIKKQQDTIDAADSRIDDRVASLLERIEVMQLSLSSKLQQADLLISQFSAQQQQLDSVIKSLSTMSFGKEKGQ